VPAVARFGVARLGGWSAADSLPPAVQDQASARGARAESVDSFLDEYLDADIEMARAGSLVDLAGKPLIVVTAALEHDQAEMSAQKAMAALSTNSVHRVVDQATHSSLLLEPDDAAETHSSLLLEPDDAAETSRAIRDVVGSVRTSGVLAQ